MRELLIPLTVALLFVGAIRAGADGGTTGEQKFGTGIKSSLSAASQAIIPRMVNYTRVIQEHLTKSGGKAEYEKRTGTKLDAPQTVAEDRMFWPPYKFPFWGLPYGIYSNGGFFNPGLFPFVPGGPAFPPYDGIFGGPFGPGEFPGPGPVPFQGPPNTTTRAGNRNYKNTPRHTRSIHLAAPGDPLPVPPVAPFPPAVPVHVVGQGSDGRQGAYTMYGPSYQYNGNSVYVVRPPEQGGPPMTYNPREVYNADSYSAYQPPPPPAPPSLPPYVPPTYPAPPPPPPSTYPPPETTTTEKPKKKSKKKRKRSKKTKDCNCCCGDNDCNSNSNNCDKCPQNNDEDDEKSNNDYSSTPLPQPKDYTSFFRQYAAAAMGQPPVNSTQPPPTEATTQPPSLSSITYIQSVPLPYNNYPGLNNTSTSDAMTAESSSPYKVSTPPISRHQPHSSRTNPSTFMQPSRREMQSQSPIFLPPYPNVRPRHAYTPQRTPVRYNFRRPLPPPPSFRYPSYSRLASPYRPYKPRKNPPIPRIPSIPIIPPAPTTYDPPPPPIPAIPPLPEIEMPEIPYLPTPSPSQPFPEIPNPPLIPPIQYPPKFEYPELPELTHNRPPNPSQLHYDQIQNQEMEYIPNANLQEHPENPDYPFNPQPSISPVQDIQHPSFIPQTQPSQEYPPQIQLPPQQNSEDEFQTQSQSNQMSYQPQPPQYNSQSLSNLPPKLQSYDPSHKVHGMSGYEGSMSEQEPLNSQSSYQSPSVHPSQQYAPPPTDMQHPNYNQPQTFPQSPFPPIPQDFIPQPSATLPDQLDNNQEQHIAPPNHQLPNVAPPFFEPHNVPTPQDHNLPHPPTPSYNQHHIQAPQEFPSPPHNNDAFLQPPNIQEPTQGEHVGPQEPPANFPQPPETPTHQNFPSLGSPNYQEEPYIALPIYSQNSPIVQDFKVEEYMVPVSRPQPLQPQKGGREALDIRQRIVPNYAAPTSLSDYKLIQPHSRDKSAASSTRRTAPSVVHSRHRRMHQEEAQSESHTNRDSSHSSRSATRQDRDESVLTSVTLDKDKPTDYRIGVYSQSSGGPTSAFAAVGPKDIMVLASTPNNQNNDSNHKSNKNQRNNQTQINTGPQAEDVMEFNEEYRKMMAPSGETRPMGPMRQIGLMEQMGQMEAMGPLGFNLAMLGGPMAMSAGKGGNEDVAVGFVEVTERDGEEQKRRNAEGRTERISRQK